MEINIDKIDLRLFNGLYTIDIVKSSSTYTNGNTVINLGGGKTLILENINKADLTSATFIFPEQPTAQPTTFPPTLAPSYSVSPTFFPTKAPSLLPSIVPTNSPSIAPTFIPSSIPTVNPSTTPTYSPTISAKPTVAPTHSPTPYPTVEGGYHEITIDESLSNPYFGTEVADKFLISAAGTTTITGGGGNDYYIVFNNLNSNLIINDFDASAPEKIDLTDFPALHSIKDLDPTSSGGYAIYKLQDSQKIKLKSITLGSITNDNFVFLAAENTLGSSDTNSDYNPMIIGLSVGLGAVFLGLCYVTYAAIYQRYPFSNHYNVSPQNEIEDNYEKHVKSLTPSAPRMVEAVAIEFAGGNNNVLGGEN